MTGFRRLLLMPTYDYACKECKKSFTVTMTMGDHDKARVVCPKCKSRKVEQRYGTVFTITSKKS